MLRRENIQPVIERTEFGFARPQVIRLLLPQYGGRPSFWTRRYGLLLPVDGSKDVENQILSIVATARRVAANAVILPELSVPEQLVHHFQEWSAETGGVAIAGSHYFKLGSRYIARCPVIISGRVFFTEKFHPAPGEVSALPNQGLVGGKRIYIFSNTPIGTFAVLICSDFLVTDIRKTILKENLDLLFVPAFQKSSNRYHTRMGMECDESKEGVYIAYCNMHLTGEADGHSALFGIVDNLWVKDLINDQITNGDPKEKLCVLKRAKQHAVIDLDIESRRPRLGRTVESRPNFQLVEFEEDENNIADHFTRVIAHEEQCRDSLAPFVCSLDKKIPDTRFANHPIIPLICDEAILNSVNVFDLKLEDPGASSGIKSLYILSAIAPSELRQFNELNVSLFKDTEFAIPEQRIQSRNIQLYKKNPLTTAFLKERDSNRAFPIGLSHVLPLSEIGKQEYVYASNLADGEFGEIHISAPGEWSDAILLFSMGIMKEYRPWSRRAVRLLVDSFYNHVRLHLEKMVSDNEIAGDVRLYLQSEHRLNHLLKRKDFTEMANKTKDGFPLFSLTIPADKLRALRENVLGK